jgi:hypothetical protein
MDWILSAHALTVHYQQPAGYSQISPIPCLSPVKEENALTLETITPGNKIPGKQYPGCKSDFQYFRQVVG